MGDSQELTDASIRQFLAALASAEATHGAVAAAAVTGGMGAALLQMVAALPLTRSGSAADRQALANSSAALSALQEQLIASIAAETSGMIRTARRMPQENPAQRAERAAAVQLALRAAADIPLAVARFCTIALRHAQTVAAHCSRAAAQDVVFAINLLRVAFSGARANLETKLSSLTDVDYTTALVDEMALLSQEAARVASEAETTVQTPPS